MVTNSFLIEPSGSIVYLAIASVTFIFQSQAEICDMNWFYISQFNFSFEINIMCENIVCLKYFAKSIHTAYI